MTLGKKEIQVLLGAIWDQTAHHGHSLKPGETKFLLDMDNQMRERKRTTFTVNQVDYLTAILVKTKQAKPKQGKSPAGALNRQPMQTIKPSQRMTTSQPL